MANSPQALKRARQAEKSRQHGASRRSTLRTTIKKVVNALEAGDKDTATEAYRVAVPAIDSAVGGGLIHKNKAARHKSRLNTRLKAL